MQNPRISPYASSTGNNGGWVCNEREREIGREKERKREECYNIDTGLSDKYIMNLPGLWQFNFD